MAKVLSFEARASMPSVVMVPLLRHWRTARCGAFFPRFGALDGTQSSCESFPRRRVGHASVKPIRR